MSRTQSFPSSSPPSMMPPLPPPPPLPITPQNTTRQRRTQQSQHSRKGSINLRKSFGGGPGWRWDDNNKTNADNIAAAEDEDNAAVMVVGNTKTPSQPYQP